MSAGVPSFDKGNIHLLSADFLTGTLPVNQRRPHVLSDEQADLRALRVKHPKKIIAYQRFLDLGVSSIAEIEETNPTAASTITVYGLAKS